MVSSSQAAEVEKLLQSLNLGEDIDDLSDVQQERGVPPVVRCKTDQLHTVSELLQDLDEGTDLTTPSVDVDALLKDFEA